MPGGYIGSIAVLILPFAVIALFTSHQSSIAWWLLLAETALPGVLYAFGRFTRAIVAASKDKDVAIEAIILTANKEAPTVSENE